MAGQAATQGLFFRLGRGARRMLRGYSRAEQQMMAWLEANGLPAEMVWAAIWVIRLAIIGILFYAAFWVAVLVMILIVAIWMAEDSVSNEEDLWPFMTQEELRTSMFYDPVLNNDVSHEQYEDD